MNRAPRVIDSIAPTIAPLRSGANEYDRLFALRLWERDDKWLNRLPVLDTGLGFFCNFPQLNGLTPCQARGDDVGFNLYQPAL